jgi:1,4-alpha-glucan branching enzyme
VVGEFNDWDPSRTPLRASSGSWGGFVPGLREGEQFLYSVDGPDGAGHKRDPRSRELTFEPAFPNCNCVLHDPGRFPWHDSGYETPPFHELVCYQLHIGTFRIGAGQSGGRFLDVARQLPYLASLGINALQLMPVVEFPTTFSLGYNGTDYFSPENDYGESDPADVLSYFHALNGLLANRGQRPYASPDQVRGSANQLRAMIDVCHVYGLAVLLDVVYNHAGGDFDANSMYFLDRMRRGNNNDSLYFTSEGWAGGLVFAYWNRDVRGFLADNARMFLDEYRVDGFRFDEVSVMDRFGGWGTCQEINAAIREANPKAIRIAEYWPVNGAVTRSSDEGGASFDATWNDRLRDSVRSAVAASSGGAGSRVDLEAVAGALRFRATQDYWRQVNCIENHDVVKTDRESRVAALADPSNSRSWYARSRSRWALGVLATAPGIPMVFMGQEFLEDKRWSDDPAGGGGALVGGSGERRSRDGRLSSLHPGVARRPPSSARPSGRRPERLPRPQ